MSVRAVPWQGWPECPCGCGVQNLKLSTKSGHVIRCSCRSCLGRRNRKKGHRGQATMHRALGGTGFTPHDEESGRTYSVEVQVEAKTGDIIPANFLRFTESEFLRRALSQAERAIPAGVQAYPAVYLQPTRAGKWLVIRIA